MPWPSALVASAPLLVGDPCGSVRNPDSHFGTTAACGGAGVPGAATPAGSTQPALQASNPFDELVPVNGPAPAAPVGALRPDPNSIGKPASTDVQPAKTLAQMPASGLQDQAAVSTSLRSSQAEAAPGEGSTRSDDQQATPVWNFHPSADPRLPQTALVCESGAAGSNVDSASIAPDCITGRPASTLSGPAVEPASGLQGLDQHKEGQAIAAAYSATPVPILSDPELPAQRLVSADAKLAPSASPGKPAPRGLARSASECAEQPTEDEDPVPKAAGHRLRPGEASLARIEAPSEATDHHLTYGDPGQKVEPFAPKIANAQSKPDWPASASASGDASAETHLPPEHKLGSLAGGMNAARLLERIGQAEIRVGMQTSDFGTIDVRTALAKHQLTAEISVQRADLGSALTAALPSLHSRLADQQLSDIQIVVHDNSRNGSTDTGLGTGQHAREQFTPQRNRMSRATEDAQTALASPELAVVRDGLDIRI